MASTWSRLCLQQVSDGVEDDGQLLGCQEGRDPRQGWNWISFQKEKEGLKHGFYSKLETEEKRQLLIGITKRMIGFSQPAAFFFLWVGCWG